MNTKKSVSGKGLLVNLVLIVLVFFEAVGCIGTVNSQKDSMEYGIEYEKDPLVLKSVEITNRQDLEEVYDLYDDERLYEVCLTYENPASYTGVYRNSLSFEDAGNKYSVFTAYPSTGGDLGQYSSYNQIVPAGKTGSMICYIVVSEEVSVISIVETTKKLSGTGEVLTMNLPARTLGTDVWKADE